MLTESHTNYRPGKDGYISEFTLFINELLAEHPEIVEDQCLGWRMYWDRQADLDEMRRTGEENLLEEEHPIVNVK